MYRPVPIILLFVLAQFLLWFIVDSSDETVFLTFFIGLFLSIFIAGFRWARWVVIILVALISLGLLMFAFEESAVGFLVIVPYFLLAFALFKYRPKIAIDKGVEITEPGSTEDLKSEVAPGFSEDQVNYEYPLLVKRYQSLLIDFFILFAIMIVTMVFLGESQIRQPVMIALGIIFLLFYEPLLTCYSATIGQHLMAIRVRDSNHPEQKINVFQAYVRLIVKWSLGWLSFITINFNPQHRAIHDIASSSVVIKIK